jgi:alpha-amylase
MMTMRLFPLLLTMLFLAGACGQAAPGVAAHPPADSASTDGPRPWWRAAVFYEVFVRSYYDSDADGIGDLKGLTQKLDYLQTLGITGLWLMPIHPSPSYHGYDVTDYYAVNPEYGTLQDFRDFLAAAHAREMHVIIDLVLNHTSNRHPFFEDALRGPASEYYDWYLWSDADPGNGWHAAPAGRFYFGYFCDCMPDFNHQNPEVAAEIDRVVRFWLEDVGVDGFRVDAAKHLIEADSQLENTPATHEWYREFYQRYKSVDQEAYAVGEVFGAGALMVKSYTGDQLDQVFNFEMASGFVNSAAGGSNTGVDSAITFSLQDMPDFNFATFLANHDQDRVMSVFNGDAGKARAAASLLLTSPGNPFLYYGEEIGMTGRKPDEDIRRPMQWSQSPGAGFTTGTPWRPPDADYVQVNVVAQESDPASLLSHYRELIRLRREHPALSGDRIHLLQTGNTGVYAALRTGQGEVVLVMVNLTGERISEYGLSLQKSVLTDAAYGAEILFGGGQVEGVVLTDGVFTDYRPIKQIQPYETCILQLVPQS